MSCPDCLNNITEARTVDWGESFFTREIEDVTKTICVICKFTCTACGDPMYVSGSILYEKVLCHCGELNETRSCSDIRELNKRARFWDYIPYVDKRVNSGIMRIITGTKEPDGTSEILYVKRN